MSKLIMVINDTKEILELFEEILTGEGYQVSLHAYNTRDLEDVKRVKPDLIISDHLVTEEQLGWQFIQKIKMCKETANIPIIICTTNWKIVQNAEGQFATRGITFVFKPFNIEELLGAVEEIIGKADEPGLGKTSLNPQAENTNQPEKS